MKKEIVYRTKQSVNNLIGEWGGLCSMTVFLIGAVERQTERRLFGAIPLPDRYVWSITTEEEYTDLDNSNVGIEEKKKLTFESQKRLGEARLAMEKLLRHKCKEYKERGKVYGYHG